MKKLCYIVCPLLLVSFTVASAESEDNNQTAYRIAETVDYMIRAVRSIYTARVVKKLKQDGVGASQDYHGKKGFIPLPAQFVQDLSEKLRLSGHRTNRDTFNFQLKSKWNLNDMHGLNSGFDQDGWKYLEQQQQTAAESGKPYKDIKWQPYTKIDTIDGKKVLRYFSADIASSAGCVTCHNKWEQDELIQAERREAGVTVGKVFKQHELMGALSITVPID